MKKEKEKINKKIKIKYIKINKKIKIKYNTLISNKILSGSRFPANNSKTLWKMKS